MKPPAITNEGFTYLVGAWRNRTEVRMPDLAISLPMKAQFSMRSSAVTQIQIDQSLIRNPHFFRNAFEVSDRIFIKPDSDGFF